MSATPDIVQLSGSGKSVDDFSSYCEGDIEPTLNKKILALIEADKSYIVYLDEDYFVEYSWNADYGETPDGYSEVANKIAHLEGLSVIYLASDQQFIFRRMLGEAMARIVGEKDLGRANEALSIGISFLNARSLERARLWYLKASGAATAFFLFFAILLWIFRNAFTSYFGINAFDVCLGGLFGALGSFLSIWIRSGRIWMDAGALKPIHQWEGTARIVVGVACALAMALAVKAGVIITIPDSSKHPLAYLLVICIIAGFSERMFLNLIAHFDDPDMKKN